MNDPINIFSSRENSEDNIVTYPDHDPERARDARHRRNLTTGVLVFLGIAVLAFLVPLSVWLTRLAGGW